MGGGVLAVNLDLGLGWTQHPAYSAPPEHGADSIDAGAGVSTPCVSVNRPMVSRYAALKLPAYQHLFVLAFLILTWPDLITTMYTLLLEVQ